MSPIGVLGGMGPAATVDFMAKLVALTPATCDQEHLPVFIANLPQVPDRSAAILGLGPDPLPQMLEGINALNAVEAGVVVIPCNTSHYWYDAIAAASRAPVLHIAEACVKAVPVGEPVAVLATRGCLRAGFYQRTLGQRGNRVVLPAPDGLQNEVDACIRAIKGGRTADGAAAMVRILAALRAAGASSAILGCTELPLAAAAAGMAAAEGIELIDSTLELARAAVAYGLERAWNRAVYA